MRKPWRRAARLLITSMFTMLWAAGTCAAQELSLANRDITIKIVGPDGAALNTSLAQNVEVVGQRVIFRQGHTVDGLLRANGVFPDGDAFGLVYDLNTCYEKLNEIRPGSVLFLPQARVREPRSPLPAGTLAVLTVEARRKERLLAAIAAIGQARGGLDQVEPALFGTGADAATVTGAVSEIGQSFELVRNVVRAKLFPLSGDVLDQLLAQAELMQSVLGNLIQSRQPLSASDKESIELVKEELRFRRARLTEARDPGEPPPPPAASRVVVRTLRPEGNNRVDVNNLRVYYIPVFFCDRAGNACKPGQLKSFDVLSSPAEQILSEANYWIWAGRGDDPSPVTDRKRQLVRRGAGGGPMPVELLVIR